MLSIIDCMQEHMGGRKMKIIWIAVGIVLVLFLLIDIAIIRAGRYTEKESEPEADHTIKF